MPRKSKDIDAVLKDWPYSPGDVSVRVVKAAGGREVLQMRVDLGVLQLETAGRPDGERPGGDETYLDHLIGQSFHEPPDFSLTEDQCDEVDREFIQYYHRRICWLALRRFDLAVKDADHTLTLMDFVKRHAPDEDWMMSHEQYRPFVLFHRTQAAALEKLEASDAESAISEINRGLENLHAVFEEYDVEERFEEDEMVGRLRELRESLRNQFNVGKTLTERLSEAVAAEEYEQAAKLRDEIQKRRKDGR